MTKSFCDNLTYLATKLHARRSRMQEGKRLETLCHIRTLPELGRAIGLDADYQAPADFQRRLAADLIHELAGYAKHLDEAGSGLFSCLLLRFEVENVKVILRGLINKVPHGELRSHLVPTSDSRSLDMEKLMNAGSLEDFAALLPSRPPYRRMRKAILTERQHPVPFFLETALDNDYFEGLLLSTRALSEEDMAAIRPLILQEANLFQLMLVIRGKFLYRLPPESLLSLGVAGASETWFTNLVAAPDMLTAAKHSVGIVLDELPAGHGASGDTPDPAVLDALAWKRYARLANMAFRRGCIGLGAVIGYAGLRRVEVANLITLSEGIRMGVTNGELRRQLIPQMNLEAIHV